MLLLLVFLVVGNAFGLLVGELRSEARPRAEAGGRPATSTQQDPSMDVAQICRQSIIETVCAVRVLPMGGGRTQWYPNYMHVLGCHWDGVYQHIVEVLQGHHKSCFLGFKYKVKIPIQG
jgi:hypothetical protein